MLTLAACALPAAVDCNADDWEAVGFADGTEATGAGPAAACATCEGFESMLWERGYVEGLAGYCTEAWIYRRARAGLSFPAVCAPHEAALSGAYSHGRAYWDLDQKMWRLRRRSRDDAFLGQRLARSARYDALRRERALYFRWPP